MALNSPIAASAVVGIDVADPEHRRRKQPAAVPVAEREGHAGAGRKIGVAGAVDEELGANCPAAGLRLDDQRGDAVAVHRGIGCEGMEQELRAAREQEIVGGAFVGRDVVGAHRDAALKPLLRRVQAAERGRCDREDRRRCRARPAASRHATGRRGRRSSSPRRRCPCRRGSRSARRGARRRPGVRPPPPPRSRPGRRRGRRYRARRAPARRGRARGSSP